MEGRSQHLVTLQVCLWKPDCFVTFFPVKGGGEEATQALGVPLENPE